MKTVSLKKCLGCELKMPYYKKYMLHWYHRVFKATPAKNLYIAYLMLTKLQVLTFYHLF